jgi:hypothetical protein
MKVGVAIVSRLHDFVFQLLPFGQRSGVLEAVKLKGCCDE